MKLIINFGLSIKKEVNWYKDLMDFPSLRRIFESTTPVNYEIPEFRIYQKSDFNLVKKLMEPYEKFPILEERYWEQFGKKTWYIEFNNNIRQPGKLSS